MTIRNLDYLFAPQSVALIGASNRPGSLGRIIARNLLRAGFQRPIWLVNPKQSVVDGVPCLARIANLPAAPDLAVIATPPSTIAGIVCELAARGTRAAVIISAGVDAAQRQAILDAARPHLLRIQGPNCLGLMLPRSGLDASFCHRMPAAGDLALVSQSGALITAVVDWASGRGIGFSHVVSLGDMADIDFGDILDYLAADTQSRAILLYMEQLTNAAKFMSAARRAARAKPVIIIKAGRHADGARAALSHTGALAGSDAAYDAAFRRAGLVRVNELEDLFNAAEMLSRVKGLEGERLLIMTNGGGAGVLAADRLADLDGHLGRLSTELMTRLDSVLPATWSHGNPVDIIGDADVNRYRRVLDLLMRAEDGDAILVMNCPTALTSSTDIAKAIIEVARARPESGRPSKPILGCWLGNGAADEGRVLLEKERIPTFSTPASAIEGFMQLVRYRRGQDELMQTPPPMPEDMPVDTKTAHAIVASSVGRAATLLTEVEAKRLLSCYGIATVATSIAATSAEVGRLAAPFLATQSAVVVKILSDDITHKSDVGGVRLGLETAGAAASAADEMMARIRRQNPTARIAGFTVQPMVYRPRAHELIVGMNDDATFGPMLLFGAGGTAVEVLRDTAMALLPVDLKLAYELMRQTRIHRLLQGFRDRPPADLEAIALTLVRLSALVIAHTEIVEIDVNPLLADEHGVIALDARVVVGGADGRRRRPLSIRPYPSEWVRDQDLPTLGPIIFRPIRPDDEARYDRFIERLNPDDMRLRFFTARPHLSRRQLAGLTQIDYAREMAFVAIDKSNGGLLGVSRLAADPDRMKAEFAVIVASDLKGRGLGWALMQLLIDYARRDGIGELFGEILAENATMLRMTGELGFAIEPHPDDPGLRRAVLRLAPEPPPPPRAGQRPPPGT